MSNIEKILEFNRDFVENKGYQPFITTKYPNKKIAVLSCMDTRLTALLPAALNFKNGEVKIITNAGAVITHPFGSVVRSLLVAIYELGVTDVMVIGHYDCGMQGLKADTMIDKMKTRGVDPDQIEMIRTCGIDLDKWLHGFDSVQDSVFETVKTIRSHPLIPKDVGVHGFIMDPETGRLDDVV